MLVTGEDAYWHRLLAGCCFRKHVGRLVEMPWNVVELEAVEFVLQLADFSAICNHLSVLVA